MIFRNHKYPGRHLLTVLFLLKLSLALGQIKPIGLPLVDHYRQDVYKGDAQNWDIVEDAMGNMYFGNNSGILKYDGEEWQVFQVNNGSMVRSLEITNHQRVYVGAYNEIGFLDRSDKGKTNYHSLNHLIPEDARDFDDVWKIHQTRYGIVFQSFEYVFIYTNDTVKVLRPVSSFGFSFYINNNLYVVEKRIGLRIYKNGVLETIAEDPLFTRDEIRLIQPLERNNLLVGSLSNGLFVLKEGALTRWKAEVNKELLNHKLYSGIRFNDQYVFGTIKNGLFITDRDGNIIQHMNRLRGLQNNTVLSIYADKLNNIWLGLDNGIDYIKTSLPVTLINYNFNIETAYTTIVFNDRIYVGTNQGLFTKKIDELNDYQKTQFEMVEGTDGQVWKLNVHDGQLLCGHNNGAYRISGTHSEKIADLRGVWNFFKINPRDDFLLSGTYNGLIAYAKDSKGRWKFSHYIKGIDISSRIIKVDRQHNIWISHDYSGLYRVMLNPEYDSVVVYKQMDTTDGLPGILPYRIHKFNNALIVSTYEGVYQYDHEQQKFFKPGEVNDLLGDLSILNYLKKDERGNIWYFTDKQMGVFRLLEDATYKEIYTPFIIFKTAIFESFENLYIMDPENVFIGTQDGLVHYAPNISKDYFYEIQSTIKEVSIASKQNDSTWYYSGNAGIDAELLEGQFAIPHSYNTLSFAVTCTDHENSDNIQYSYRLLGFSEDWSSWAASNIKEYTNLPAGEYTFEVRARNIYHNLSSTDQFSFIVSPPFYQSKIAIVIYLILAVVLLAALVVFVTRGIEKARAHEKIKQMQVFEKKEQKLTEERNNVEAEVARLRSEKLEVEMKHKNKELVNSTYHIIQKNKFLNYIKQELSNLSDKARSELVEEELRRISRKIDRDISNKKNWEVFNQYFDEVHQEFLHRLKEKHPDLTPNEMRLSTYLRMNISTKEIAPLMNISIRGVEISRYRLRKKLNLDRDTNLTEYIMQI